MVDIRLAGTVIGLAEVYPQGLYTCFCCQCRLSGEILYRLTVRCGERTENLGIPVPEGGQFVLRTRIPTKRLGEGPLQILAVPKRAELGEKFIPLAPEEPFRYLRRLQDAFLQVRDEQVGVVIRDHP